MSERADFRQFYRDTHAVDNLSEREKMFIGPGGGLHTELSAVSRTAPCGRKESRHLLRRI